MHKVIIYLSSTFILCSGLKFVVIPDERLQYCHGPFVGRDIVSIGNVTDVDIESLLHEENQVTLNGTCKWKVPVINGSLYVRITGEKYVRNVWIPKITKDIKDYCTDYFNPYGIFYAYSKDYKKCPLEAGDIYELDHVKFDLSYLVFPPDFHGRWRARIENFYQFDGHEAKDCWLMYVDVEYT